MKVTKKKIILAIAALFLIAVATLAAVHVQNSKSVQSLYDAQEIAIYQGEQQVAILSYAALEALSTTFSATFQRQVGGAYDYTYKGVPASSLLEACGISITDESVCFVALDSYSIALTAAELLQEDNVYLVFEQDGEALDSDSGTYMLVIKNDEVSTRWNKQVVEIKISEAAQ